MLRVAASRVFAVLPTRSALGAFRCSSAAESAAAKAEVEKLVKANKLVLFMKGTPAQPVCGFSRAVVQILDMHGVPHDKIAAYNVMAEEHLRSGVKLYTDWPTIPQVFFDGEFVGGCDAMIQYHQSGELKGMLEKVGLKSSLPEQGEKAT